MSGSAERLDASQAHSQVPPDGTRSATDPADPADPADRSAVIRSPRSYRRTPVTRWGRGEWSPGCDLTPVSRAADAGCHSLCARRALGLSSVRASCRCGSGGSAGPPRARWSDCARSAPRPDRRRGLVLHAAAHAGYFDLTLSFTNDLDHRFFTIGDQRRLCDQMSSSGPGREAAGRQLRASNVSPDVSSRDGESAGAALAASHLSHSRFDDSAVECRGMEIE